MTNTTTTPTRGRSRLLPLVAVGLGITAATGVTALGFPLPQAEAAPGDEIDAGTFDLGTLAEGDELPGGGGGVSSLDLSQYGVPAGTVLTEPGAAFEIGSNDDGYLRWSWVGADVVGQLGYGPMTHTVTIHTPNGEIVVVRFTFDWSAAAPEEPEEPEEPWEAPDLRAFMASGSTDHCVAGDLRVPLASATHGQTLDGLTFDGFEPNAAVPFAESVIIDGHDVVFVGYDPAARATGEPANLTFAGGTVDATNADGDTDETRLDARLGVWCGTDASVAAGADGSYEVLLEDLFANLTSPDSLHLPDGGIGAMVAIEALPTPEQGHLLAFDAAGNQLELGRTEAGVPAFPATTHRLVFEPAEGADSAGFELVVGLHTLKGIVPAPVTVSFEPVPEVPEEPTPEEPEEPVTPDEPEPETPTTPVEVEVPRVSE